MNPLRCQLFFLLGLLAWATPAAAVIWQDVVPNATADAVRIRARLQTGDETGTWEIRGRIVRVSSGEILWQGALGNLTVKAQGTANLDKTLASLPAVPWSPTTPVLYTLELTAWQEGKMVATYSNRIGFRTFTSQNGQFLLNGRPIFLRGTAINPPGRTIPDETGDTRAFAEAYVRFLKARHVNAIRLAKDSQVWFDVCDELGMLVFQGRYGGVLGGSKNNPPKDFDRSVRDYQALFTTYARHPSICVYVLSNEMPFRGEQGQAFHDFLARLHTVLSVWDPTHLYIGNAGYGEGREGDICDVHRYWGWYYNSFLTYYNLRDNTLFGDPEKNQPLTFSECVGAFSGVNGAFNLIVSRQSAAQLNWTGHAEDQPAAARQYQAFLVREATESFRRLRSLQPRLAGIMPFTIFFDHWSGITNFAQMQAKPALEQLGISYQPVLLSWELWTSQVYAGATLHPVAHVINDSDDNSNLKNATLNWQIRGEDGRVWRTKQLVLPDIAYYGNWQQTLTCELPENLPTGHYQLAGQVFSGEKTVSTNQASFFVAGRDWTKVGALPKFSVAIFDPEGKTRAALAKLGVNGANVTNLALWRQKEKVLVLGEGLNGRLLATHAEPLRQYLAEGGRILWLRPEAGTFPTNLLPSAISFPRASANDPEYLPKERPFADNMNINLERPEHPVFRGLDRSHFALWSDFTGWDQTKPGFPQVYPVTAGFRLIHPEALATTAVLADYDRGLEGVALAEVFAGKGSVLLSGFALAERAGLDPVADRLLRNLVAYALSPAGHEAYPFIDQPILWGNFATEKGLVPGSLPGLVIHAEWQVPPTNPEAKPLRTEDGAWSVKPGDQFVAAGRRLLGKFSYSTATSLRDLEPQATTGTGTVRLRIPAGKTKIITRVKNPGRTAEALQVGVNQPGFSAPATLVPEGQIITITTPLPPGETTLSLSYTGPKTLILLETHFE